MSDPEDPSDSSRNKARERFPFFYAAADEEEIFWMDILLSMSQGLAINIEMPRPRAHPELRESIERIGWNFEANFMMAREKVRNCPAFQNLDPTEQRRIIEALFDPFLSKRPPDRGG